MSESEQTSITSQPTVHPEVTPDTVRRHLLRILSSEAFQGSRRSGSLLEAVVEARLENRREDLKEHRLAQRFFPDLSGFKSSSIYKMRGVFKRMRSRLQVYYRSEGRLDDVIIGFPSGLYVPEFTLRSGRIVELLSDFPVEPFSDTAVEAESHSEESVPALAANTIPPPPVAEAPKTSPAAPKPSGPRLRRRRRSREGHPASRSFSGYRWPLALAIGAVPVLAGVGLLLSSRTGVLAPLPELEPMTRLTGEKEVALDPALSSNGKYLVYASDREGSGNLNIWMMALDETPRAARRLTTSSFEDSQPTVSPDGGTVAYHSIRDGGAIWIVSTKPGSEPRKLAEGGRRPRFSPDGTKIAYWSANRSGGQIESRLYVIAASGGEPRQLARNFQNAEHPAWSPSGDRILFAGRPIPEAPKYAEDEPVPEPMDWWVTKLDDDPPVRTNALPIGASDILFGPPSSWTPYSNRILADSMQAGVRRPLAIAMDPSYRRMGSTELLASKGLANGQPFLANGRMVSSQIDILSQVAALPIDRATGLAGPAQPLSTTSGGNEFLPALNATGTQLSFVAERKGSFNAYVREIATGTERTYSSNPQGWAPLYSRDGRSLAVLYPTMGQPGTAIGTGAVEVQGPNPTPRPVPCDRCERLITLTNDGQKLLYLARNPRNPAWVGMLDLATKRHSTILGHPNVITAADWSPNQRLLAFSNRVLGKGIQIMAVPYSGAGEPGPAITLVPTPGNNDRPRFSADGRLLYFTSDRDGYQCLYSVAIDWNGTAAGEPRSVHHFHQRRLAIDAVPAAAQALTVSADRIALTVQSVRSGIYLSSER